MENGSSLPCCDTKFIIKGVIYRGTPGHTSPSSCLDKTTGVFLVCFPFGTSTVFPSMAVCYQQGGLYSLLLGNHVDLFGAGCLVSMWYFRATQVQLEFS
jgi:hypothetical protein